MSGSVWRVSRALLVSVVALGATGLAATTTTVAAPVADPQTGEPWQGDSFGGYVGVVDGAGGSAGLPTTDDPSTKTESPDFEENQPGRVDVPGEGPVDAAGEEAAPDLVQPHEARGDSAVSLRRAVVAAAADPNDVEVAGGAATGDGTVRAVVSMNVAIALEADLGTGEVVQQRARIDDSIETLTRLLDGTGSAVVQPYEVLPAAVVTLDRAGLKALLASEDVTAITLDRALPAALDVSTGVIDSDLLNLAGVTGSNYEGSMGGRYEVAILDSGVLNSHQAFAGRIVAQACFSAGSWCPNGGTSQIGGNAGQACTYSTGTAASECQHGTHVAGIAAGAAFTGGHEGVAPGAGVIAVQIGSRLCSSPNYCWRYYFSDLDLALQHVYNLRVGGRNIAAVNMSLGGPLSTNACDASYATTQNLFSQLLAQGVAPVAAAGNDGSQTQISYPGCLSGSYAISATDDNDVPAGFTNSNALTTWWAPGVSIDAPISTGDTAHGNKSGTSMATPHVVGAFAALRECITYSSASGVAGGLSNSGVNVTRNGVTRRRINVLDAATATVNNNDFASPESFNGNGPFNDYDWNVCADAEPGEPGPGSIENSIWWTWTPATTGTATISTNDSGGNVTTFDTTLTIFSGNSLGSLTTLAYDDDSGDGLRSLVTLPVNGGQTYRIRVDGFGGSNGELNLHIENGPPPTCRGIPATRVGTTNNDVINGTAGNDVILAGEGDDTVNGLAGDDVICLGGGNDTSDGGSGNDTIDAESGTDTVQGGDGADSVFGGPDADAIFGGPGNDLILGNAGGGDTNDVGDVLYGDDGDDVIDGWVGDDILLGGAGDDDFWGADGIDLVSFSGSPSGVRANLATGLATGEGNDEFKSPVENLEGSAQRDLLTGDDNPNHLQGLGGNDFFNGQGGNDLIEGGDGNDSMRGEQDDDVLDGGPGTDTATFVGVPGAGVTASLLTGTASGQGSDTLVGIENLDGSPLNDVLVGDNAANRIRGNTGNDVINGEAGHDTLIGQAGNDTLRGELGNDKFDGNAGNDTVTFLGVASGVSASLTTGSASGQGNDTILRVENLDGSNKSDVLIGKTNANRLRGMKGNDDLRGVNGNDLLEGGSGRDQLDGGAGNDNCDGNGGTDTATRCEVVLNIP